ncbi:Fic family protein [Nesterenkonia muleiensis]|uniref:Fic family protein n=1 Tax=Nesterenkonia muleiensis TaxID=2282648 RepID=UPI00192E562C
MEVQGYGAAAQWVYRQALEPGGWSTEGVISIYEVRQVHHRAMSPVWAVAPHPVATDAAAPGNFREHDIQPFQGGMTPQFWPLVPAAIEEWVRFVNTHTEELRSRQVPVPWPERLAEVHNRFEKVHPFLDGNGRAGRLLLNLILVRLGYPPVIILKRQRPAYLKAMQRADDEDYGPLGELLARAMYENLNRFIVPNVAGPARLVPLRALADKDLTVVALRHAARRGRLDAVHGSDGEWRSTRKAVKRSRRSR